MLRRFWPDLIGVAAGLLSGAIIVLTLGVAILFETFWSCNPHHRVQPDPNPCSGMVIGATMLAVALLCLGGAGSAFILTRRIARRWFSK
ncbi:MAG: hypothetical protein PGN08_03535 [Sphingomonas taxi]